jgi:predicted transcriptional regulator
MPEPSEKELLQGIQQSLAELKSLFILANQEKLAAAKCTLLKEGTMKTQIYNLCEEPKTTQEIAQSIQKQVEYVNSYLSRLRNDGLIKTIEKDGKQTHAQIF